MGLFVILGRRRTGGEDRRRYVALAILSPAWQTGQRKTQPAGRYTCAVKRDYFGSAKT
jgi:hypothetical protein